MSSCSLGIDIGGTFTDVVIYRHDDGCTFSHKELTTPSNPTLGVMTGVRYLLAKAGLQPQAIGKVVHATTLFANALIERRGAVAGLITTKGFRDALEMRREFTARAVNEGFSGGEKKRNEILQMALLEPRLAVLDETDSGLDIDALKIVSEGVNRLRGPKRSFVVITHYQRLLNYIVPDVVHVLSRGRIVKTGGKDLALELEARGYAEYQEEAAA